jgi:hypothetical protein
MRMQGAWIRDVSWRPRTHCVTVPRPYCPVNSRGEPESRRLRSPPSRIGATLSHADTINRMLDPKVFKAYDVRGIYRTELDEAGAYAIGRAYVEQF